MTFIRGNMGLVKSAATLYLLKIIFPDSLFFTWTLIRSFINWMSVLLFSMNIIIDSVNNINIEIDNNVNWVFNIENNIKFYNEVV
ncbi:hypothetical protein JTE87_04082 [Bacillus amyloliquefaciens]|nr:hypothetical protein [Bacillus amyloliquefaciens]